MNAHLPCTTLYYNYVRLSTGLCKYFKQGSEANIRVHQMSGSTAGWSEIRSAVREEAGQGGAQSTQARQRPRHLPQDAARGATYSRRTRRTATKDTRALRFLNRGKPSYAHGFTSAHRRGRKQYAIPQNKNAPRPKHESPCAPPKLKECLPPDAGKQCAFPDAEKTRPPLRRKNAPCPK